MLGMSALANLYQQEAFSSFGRRIEKTLGNLRSLDAEADPATLKREQGNFRRMLDKIFWEGLEKISLHQSERSHFSFSDAELLWVSSGYLHDAQLEDEDNEESEQHLLKILLQKSGEGPIYHLHEWISFWKTQFELFSDEAHMKEEDNEILDDEKAVKFQQNRLLIYKRLIPTIQRLPGINRPFLENLISGELDRKVEQAIAIRESRPMDITLSHRRLISIHGTFMDQLRQAISDPKEKGLLAVLEKITVAFTKRRIQREQGVEGDEPSPQQPGLRQWVLGEIKLLRSLLPIGGMEGKEFFTTPILTRTDQLHSKRKVRDMLEIIHACDPHIPKDLPILIMPYKGSGFFEWDKNTLILPLTPSMAPREVIIRAAGNYRILMDNIESGGALKREYERQFEKQGFKERFLRDYTQWMLHIAVGHRNIMNTKKMDFFTSFVGPDPEKLLSSPQLFKLNRAQLKKKAEALSRNSQPSQEDYLQMAQCFWLSEDLKKALHYGDIALTAGRPHARVLLINAYLSRAAKDKLKATQMFKRCLRSFKDTLWGAYAARELEKK